MAKLLIRFKLPIFILFLIITAVLAPFAAKVKPNNSAESMSVIDDPALTLMQKLQKLFGNNEFLVVTLQMDDALSGKNLKLIQNLSKDLEKVSGIRKVLSLTNLSYAYSQNIDGDEILDIGPLISKPWIETGVPANQRERILKTQPYQRLFFDIQGKAISIFAEFEPLGDDNDKRDTILSQVETLIKPYESQVEKVFMTGMPVVDRFAFGVIENERFILTGALIALCALILWIVYRRIALVLLPLGLMTIVMTWTMAFIYLTDRAFSWILALAPVVILIVSVCDSIHIINCYFANLHLPLEERFRVIVKKVGVPCLVTSVTTALGFFSIATSLILPLRDFGIVVGLGVMGAFLVSIFMLPLSLSWLKPVQVKGFSKKYEEQLKNILNKIHELNIKKTGLVLFLSLASFALVAAGIFFIDVDEHIFSMHKGSEAKKLRKDVEYISSVVGAGSEFYLYMNPGEEDFFLQPEVLKKIEHYQQRIVDEVDIVFQSMSFVDLVKSLHQALNNNDPKFYTIPDSKETIAQLLFLYSSGEYGDELYSLVTPDYSQMRVRIFGGISDSAQETDRSISQAWQIVKEEGLMAYNPSTSGRPLLMINTMFYILDSQVLSLLFAFLTITVTLSILFKSIKLGVFSLIPNAVPIMMTMGVIGWTPIYLGVGTSMVAAVALGIAVDDTIHMLWSFRAQIRKGDSYEQALKSVFDTVGPAVVNTSLILTVGFLGMLVSQVHPSTHFGILISVACLFALIYDLFLLPTLLLKLRPVKVESDELNQKLIETQVSQQAGSSILESMS